MSYLALLNRSIQILRQTVTSTDVYGDEVRLPADPDPDPVAARRETLEVDEDERGRDQQVTRYRYFLPAGTAIAGHDTIIDGGETLEVDGPPDIVDGRYGEHHREVIAHLITG